MTNYGCCYSSGRQFIFTERPKWALGCLCFFAAIGIVAGLITGVVVSFGGFLAFECILSASAIIVVFRVYFLCFSRANPSFDKPSYIFAVLTCAIAVTMLWAAVRYSIIFDLSIPCRCLLYSGTGVVLGLGVYGYVLTCCQEDERKHHLTICSPCGKACLGAGGKFVEQAPLDEGGLEELTRFWAWIASLQWLFSPYGFPDDGQCASNESIIIHNHTLKLIKVCFYASDDLCCWVPFGGISGRCVGFIQAEQCRSFRPPRCSEIKGGFKLKIFQPGLFDKELASCSKVQPGQSFAFYDVECMVRRSRGLAASPKRMARENDASDSLYHESSESELENTVPRNLMSQLSDASNDSGGSSKELGHLGGLKRNGSAGDLQLRPHRADSSSSHCSSSPSGGLRGESRRAAPNEVVVRNRSNSEIRALLFKSTDYCCMVPLVGHLLACGDTILPDAERRFNPKASDENMFTLKVYSVGPGAKELTYLTVERGQAYTFCDSLLS